MLTNLIVQHNHWGDNPAPDAEKQLRAVRKPRGFWSTVDAENDPFTKTGSGRTNRGENANKRAQPFEQELKKLSVEELRPRAKALMGRCENASSCDAIFILKTIILPRQARDKHGENSKRDAISYREWDDADDALATPAGGEGGSTSLAAGKGSGMSARPQPQPRPQLQ
jgi:hypothetical protein